MVLKEQPIGLMDSGLGGLSVVHVLKQMMPDENILYFGDSQYAPYGLKTRQEILERCQAICDHLVEQGAKAIVIACNTATSACVEELRARYSIPIIGMEPALKPASLSDEPKNIAVWATRLTLGEEKFARLLKRVGKNHSIERVACSRLVELVENGQLEDRETALEALRDYLQQSGDPERIVLGCTHFYFFKSLLQEVAPEVEIYEGHAGTISHLREVLESQGLLNENGGSLTVENSRADQIERSYRLLDYLEENDV